MKKAAPLYKVLSAETTLSLKGEPLDKSLQLLYDSQHKENLFSLRSKELCTLIFNFPKLFRINVRKRWIVVLARKRHCFLLIWPNRAFPSLMSIFSLVKGEKEHEVFEMRMRWGNPE